MLNKSTFFAALFVLLGFTIQFASAAPPACVLACVNEQKEVYNYQDICKANLNDVAVCLKKTCDSKDYDDAVTNYKASCKQVNIDVVMPTALPTSTSSSKTTGSTKSVSATSTPTGTNNSTSTQSPKENSGSTTYCNSMVALIAVFAAAVAF